MENSKKLVQYGRGSKACTVTANFKGSETKALTEIGMPRFHVFFFPSSFPFLPPHFSFGSGSLAEICLFANSVAQTAPHRPKMAKKVGMQNNLIEREKKKKGSRTSKTDLDSESPQLSLLSFLFLFFSALAEQFKAHSSAFCNV